MLKLIERLDFAYIDCDESVLFRGGSKEQKIPIGCFAWLLQDDQTGRYTLIDTGIDDIDAVNGTKRGTSFWHRGQNGISLKDHLLRLDIDASKVDNVIITHAHYDHLSGVSAVPIANIYITELAFRSAIDPQNPNAKYLAEAADFLNQQYQKHKVFFTKDGESVSPGLKVIHANAHTAGDQLVSLQNAYGNYLFTGDALFLRENVTRDLPIGFGNDSTGAEKVLDICKNYDGHIMTGHDLACKI